MKCNNKIIISKDLGRARKLFASHNKKLSLFNQIMSWLQYEVLIDATIKGMNLHQKDSEHNNILHIAAKVYFNVLNHC